MRLEYALVILLLGASSAFAAEIHVPAAQPTIQAGIASALPGDEVVVAPGTYPEAIDLLGKAIIVRGSGGAAVTVIDGLGLGASVISCLSGEGNATTIRGFTVLNGTGTQSGSVRQGLGMIIVDSSPTVVECIFEGLSVAPFLADGGAIACFGSSPRIIDCHFEGNTANFGGAILNSGVGFPEVVRCTFVGNEAPIGDGGGILSTGGKITIEGCIFTGNTATFRGGAVKTSTNGIPNAASRIVNCLFVGNSADQGGAIYNHSGHTTITNCTIAANSAVTSASAVHGETAHIANTIIWDNGSTAPISGSIWSIEYSIVQGGYAGAGNLALDPELADPAGGDFSLGATSPGIDAGWNGTDIDFVEAGPQPIPAVDLAEFPRFSDVPSVADTGLGAAPIVDIGCYELQGAPFIRGDANIDVAFDIADPVHTLGILFGGGSISPDCEDAADANDDGAIDIADAIYELSSLFAGGPAPTAPFPGCGADATADSLGCDDGPPCP